MATRETSQKIHRTPDVITPFVRSNWIRNVVRSWGGGGGVNDDGVKFYVDLDDDVNNDDDAVGDDVCC